MGDEAADENGDAVSVQVSVITEKRKKKKKTQRDDKTETTYSLRTTHGEGCEGIPEDGDTDGMRTSDDRLVREMTAMKQEMKKLVANQMRMLDVLVGGDR